MFHLLAMLLFVGGASNPIVFHHPETGFTMKVPEHWTVVDEPFYIYHFRDVFVAFNNIGNKDLQVREWREGNRETCGSYAVSKQLEPGTVYLDIGWTRGPPPIMPLYKWFPEDGLVHRKTEFLNSRKPHYEADGVVAYVLQFHKFAELWDVRIYCRTPINPNDLELALEAIASIEFVEVPISTPPQAVEAVIPHLPAEVQPKPEWHRGCDMPFKYKIETQHVADTFVVRIIVLDGTQDRIPMKTYEYRVYGDGRVEFIGEEGSG